MSKTSENVLAGGFGHQIPVNQDNGDTQSLTDGYLPIGQNVEWVPAEGEIGYTINNVFYPLDISYAVPTRSVFADAFPVYQQNGFPSANFPISLSSYPGRSAPIEAPQILGGSIITTVLDTPQDAATNPGILVASPSLYRFPGRLGHNDSGYAPNHPSYTWTGTTTWNSGTKKLSITSTKNYDITYAIDSGTPTPYTAAVTINDTATVTFYFTDDDGKTSPTYSVYIEYTGATPPATFTRSFPTILYDDWDDSGTSLPPTGWEDTCGVAYRWTYGVSAPADPQPQLKSSAAIGTRVTGRFLPSPLVNGVLKTRAYRYGFGLSAVTTTSVTVKIGKLTASWDSTNELLTLSTHTSGATIKYSLDGSAPSLTYSTPISISDTTTVKFKAQKTGLNDSDIQTVELVYESGPPADFEINYYTALPSETISQEVHAAIRPYRNPSIFISPAGGGDGLTKATPTDLRTGVEMAFPPIAIQARYNSSTDKIYFVWHEPIVSYASPLPTLYYGIDSAPSISATDSLYFSFSGNEINFELRNVGGTQSVSDTWKITKRTGADTITADWDFDTKLLTISGIPSNIQLNCDILATPVHQYFNPIEVVATSDYKIKMISSVGSTDVGSINNIDPDVTPSFTQNINLTWTNTNARRDILREGDVVWISEGDYTITVSDISVNGNIKLLGGFNSDFTIRDRKNYPTIITSKGYGFYSSGNYGLIDGLTFNYEMDGSRALVYNISVYYHCNFNITYADSPWVGTSTHLVYLVGHKYYCDIDVDLSNPPSQIAETDVQILSLTYCSNVTINNTTSDSWTDIYDYFFPRTYIEYAQDSTINITQTTGDNNHSGTWGMYSNIGINVADCDVNIEAHTGDLNNSGGSSEARIAINYNAERSTLNIEAKTGENLGGSPDFQPLLLIYGSKNAEVDVTVNAESTDAANGTSICRFETGNSSAGGFAGDCTFDITLKNGTAPVGYTAVAEWWDYTANYGYKTEIPTVTNLVENVTLGYYPNPIRKDSTLGRPAWYGGTPDGKGIPCDGYEVGGAGTDKGRYWEA